MAIGCPYHSGISIGYSIWNVSVDTWRLWKGTHSWEFYYFSCQSVQNLGLAVVSMFAGMIVDNGGYFMLEVFFLCWLSSKFCPYFSIESRLYPTYSLIFFHSCSPCHRCDLDLQHKHQRKSEYDTERTRNFLGHFVSLNSFLCPKINF